MDLGFHGDAELAPGLIDLAVNVRTEPLPDWLAGPIAASLAELARYPDGRAARAAVAARHRRPPEEVALAAAGHRVERALLAPPDFRLDPEVVPGPADLVVIGNPTNPTSVAHPAGAVAALARPGRLLVVDEAFADTVPGEPDSLSRRRDLPGLVVLRSFTKTWGLAGLRVGYVLGPAGIVERLARVQPLWAVSTPALAAALACASPPAVAAERGIALTLAGYREHLLAGLRKLPGVTVAGAPASGFVLIQVPHGASVRARLRRCGFAVRRGDSFPGLGPDWLRIAVRDTATSDSFLTALEVSLG